MTQQFLADIFRLNRRYARSINLERDLDLPETVLGYLLTERSSAALQRILAAMQQAKAEQVSANSPRATCAWTLTGVYGTGKSAFAHYLAALCAPADDAMRHSALEIAATGFGKTSDVYQTLVQAIPSQGLFRAVAVGQREPLRYTIVRALERGIDGFWQKKRKPAIAQQITDWAAEIAVDRAEFTSQQVLAAVRAIAAVAKTDILLIIDELGKNLEFAAHHPGSDDLYLLQQLAELPRQSQKSVSQKSVSQKSVSQKSVPQKSVPQKSVSQASGQVYVIGLLHQAFAEYSQRLAAAEKNEWAKIQGRFEDIPFTESAEQMTRLIGQAIDSAQAGQYADRLQQQAGVWSQILKSATDLPEISPAILAAAFPLHPIAALVLPMLCTRYAQNDRSLFTFLTSSEPYSFANFLAQTPCSGDEIPTLKLHQIYDYFVESVGSGIGSRPNLQRWLEIQGLVADAKHLDPASVKVLKTIGILNLITATGALRATRSLVKLALVDQVSDRAEQPIQEQPIQEQPIQQWDAVIAALLEKGLITYRRQLDELRIWEGSDFDVEREITAYVEKERSPLARILTQVSPLKPLIAQRHSYRTGTLRYFERQYLETTAALETLRCTASDCDGLIVYWLHPEPPAQVPTQTQDGKPLILLTTANLTILKVRSLEFAALKQIQVGASQLQTDGVARREVRHRLVQARRLLDEALGLAFNLAAAGTRCWIEGEPEAIYHTTDFNTKLSEVCDRVYHQTPVLWNELINRRELTSQGAKARRELIEAMLERSSQARLGLTGYGPEVAMYYSVLGETGIHRQDTEQNTERDTERDTQQNTERDTESSQLAGREWGFQPPLSSAGILPVWQAIEAFCLQAKDRIQPLDRLYAHLEAPPYGVKRGVIPVLLAAVLVYHFDDVSIYKDGTFIPVLSSEHFELLVKDPARYGIKYVAVAGLRAQVFRELESVLRGAGAKIQSKGRNATVRNTTLLSVVKPLFQFVRRLPAYTLKTKRLSPQAQAVLQTLMRAQEPDELIFKALPEACGLAAIAGESPDVAVGSTDTFSTDTFSIDTFSIDTVESSTTAKLLRKKLVQSLQEIQNAYENLLSQCQTLLHSAFGVRQEEKLREDLRVRSRYLVDQCIDPLLRRFTLAAIEETTSDQEWIEALVMIVADKPAESWTDEDVTAFELKLSDLARRFCNLEALRTEVAAQQHKGFEARRVTITRSTGQEVHRMVWLDHEQRDRLESLVDELVEKVEVCDDPQLQQALVAILAERILENQQTRAKAKVAPARKPGVRGRSRQKDGGDGNGEAIGGG